ncbi:MAG: hypothetical protein QM737_22770 [Ferruginibacter sp.]
MDTPIDQKTVYKDDKIEIIRFMANPAIFNERDAIDATTSAVNYYKLNTNKPYKELITADNPTCRIIIHGINF